MFSFKINQKKSWLEWCLKYRYYFKVLLPFFCRNFTRYFNSATFYWFLIVSAGYFCEISHDFFDSLAPFFLIYFTKQDSKSFSLLYSFSYFLFFSQTSSISPSFILPYRCYHSERVWVSLNRAPFDVNKLKFPPKGRKDF